MLLSHLGVESLLVSRYPETSRYPKAHVLNQRSMEIFTDIGVAPAILERSAPTENLRGVGWYSGLSGDGPGDGYAQRLAFIEGWGGGYTDPDYIAASPCPSANLPLIRLEPILKAHAESNPEADVRFFHELVNLSQDSEGVTATILDRRTLEQYRVRSSYLVAADGGRTAGKLVGSFTVLPRSRAHDPLGVQPRPPRAPRLRLRADRRGTRSLGGSIRRVAGGHAVPLRAS
jgi:2,4-dichlorophenol 6-monooxygenase